MTTSRLPRRSSRRGDLGEGHPCLRSPDGPTREVDIELPRCPRTPATGTHDPNVIVKGVEVQLPRKLLARGMSLVDTPGISAVSVRSRHRCAGRAVGRQCGRLRADSSGRTPAPKSTSWPGGRLVPAGRGSVKIDFYPAWRKVLEINGVAISATRAYDLKIIPVSSLLRTEAVRRNDKDLNADRVAELVRTLSNDIVGRADILLRNRACEDLVGVCDQLATQFDAELSALNDPEQADALVRKLSETKARSEQLRSQAAKWSTTLSDGVSDLGSDVDFDFRQRMRRITQEADQAIDNERPGRHLERVPADGVNTVSYEVVANHKVVVDRSSQLGREVEHFELAGGELLARSRRRQPVTSPAGRCRTQVEMKESTLGGQGLTVVRRLLFRVLDVRCPWQPRRHPDDESAIARPVSVCSWAARG
ncbi:MAG: hypothetical protein R2710_01950 [Acidimicrobiales bacterium]